MVKPDWITKVRLELNDIPDEYISDENILTYLVKAQSYVDVVVTDNVSETLYNNAVVALATYYTYIGYTSLVARRLGSIPEYSEERANQLKNIALKFVRLVSKYTIDDNFEIVTNEDVKPIAFGLCGTL